MEALREFRLQSLYDICCSVWRTVLNHKYVKSSIKAENRPDNLLYVFLLVVSRNDYYFLVHILYMYIAQI